MSLKFLLLLALFAGSVAGQGIIERQCQAIRSGFLADKGNLVQRLDAYFFNIYNRLRSTTDNIVSPILRFAPNWSAACANFSQLKSVKGAGTINNYCRMISGSLKEANGDQKEWMTSFYYNELGMTTDFLDAVADAWPIIEVHLNTILDFQLQNAECVRLYAGNYSQIYMPFFTFVGGVYGNIYNNQTSFFKKSTDAANAVPGIVNTLSNALMACVNGTSTNDCVSKFIATHVSDCQTSGCQTAYDKIKMPFKRAVEDMSDFKDFYDAQLAIIKDNYGLIEDNMMTWTQMVSSCIENGNGTATTTTARTNANANAAPAAANAANAGATTGTTTTTTTARAANNSVSSTTVRAANSPAAAPSSGSQSTLKAGNDPATTTTTVKAGSTAATTTTAAAAAKKEKEDDNKGNNGSGQKVASGQQNFTTTTVRTTVKAAAASVSTAKAAASTARTTVKAAAATTARATVKNAKVTTKAPSTTQRKAG